MVTAILVVAVAASAAAYMLSQQSATLNQTALVASRAQADSYAQAGLDWARGILAEDARTSAIDTLDEGWARPLAGLPVERAIVSGAIADLQSRFNLNNVVKDGRRSDADVHILTRLLDSLGLDPGLALAVLDWVDADGDLAGSTGAEDAFYLSLPRPHRAANRPMVQVEELYTRARLRRGGRGEAAPLRDRASGAHARERQHRLAGSAGRHPAGAFPRRDPRAGRLRRARPFRDRADLKARANKAAPSAIDANLDVKSDHFLVQVGVALDDVQVASEALVARGAAGATPATVIIWRRPLY